MRHSCCKHFCFPSSDGISSTVWAELCRWFERSAFNGRHACSEFGCTRSLSAGEVGASVSRHSYIFLHAKIRFHGMQHQPFHSSHSLRHLHPTNSTPMHPNYVLFLSYGIADSRLDPVRIHSESLFPSPFTMHVQRDGGGNMGNMIANI